MKFPWAKKQQPVRQPHIMAGQDQYMFRRSRTLTGSVSSQVTAGAQDRSQLKTDRLKLMELKAHRRKVLHLLGGVLAAVAVLTLLLTNFIVTPVISARQPSANKPPAEVYQQTIYQYFADHPLERFGFAMQPAGLEAALKQKHTELDAVHAQRDWYGGNVRFVVDFRQPLLVWRSNEQQFFVDARGVAFTYNHFAEPMVAVTDQSGIPPDQTGTVASSRFIRFLGRMVGALNGYNKGVVKTVIIPASTREIDLKLDGRDYIIKTNIDRDPLQQAEDIANTLTYFDAKGIKPEYIDVRVEHKAFYKG